MLAEAQDLLAQQSVARAQNQTLTAEMAAVLAENGRLKDRIRALEAQQAFHAAEPIIPESPESSVHPLRVRVVCPCHRNQKLPMCHLVLDMHVRHGILPKTCLTCDICRFGTPHVCVALVNVVLAHVRFNPMSH